MIENSPQDLMEWKEDQIKITITEVGEALKARQLTELKGSEWILREVQVYIPSAADDAYFHLNTSSSDDADTRFGEAYYNAASFIIFDGTRNGRLDAPISTKPYLHITAGTGSTAQTVYVNIKYYYK